MAIRVLIVDDSRFFRRRVTEMLESDKQLQVIGVAENGLEAIDMTAKLKPDVITMDIEMPVMDGITAVRRIMASNPTPILMFSSLTTDGAQATFDALDAGAVDFLPKRFEDISHDKEQAKKLLCTRVLEIGSRKRVGPSAMTRPASTRMPTTPMIGRRINSLNAHPVINPVARPNAAASTHNSLNGSAPVTTSGIAASRGSVAPGWLRTNFQLVAIGASTGGPVALQDVLTKLPANFPLPIVMAQHMPATFTAAFSQRLARLCKIGVKEAADGDVLTAGMAYLAPGGRQMLIEKHGSGFIIRIKEALPGHTYKPCVDITFSSVSKCAPGKVLSIILTGMGADGREGMRELKKDGSIVWAQDEASSVVWGMPGAVVEAGLADLVLPIQDVGTRLGQGA